MAGVFRRPADTHAPVYYSFAQGVCFLSLSAYSVGYWILKPFHTLPQNLGWFAWIAFLAATGGFLVRMGARLNRQRAILMDERGISKETDGQILDRLESDRIKEVRTSKRGFTLIDGPRSVSVASFDDRLHQSTAKSIFFECMRRLAGKDVLLFDFGWWILRVWPQRPRNLKGLRVEAGGRLAWIGRGRAARGRSLNSPEPQPAGRTRLPSRLRRGLAVRAGRG